MRKRFIWLGSQGFVHNGLDLVLEAFAGMPDYQLTVCGPLHEEAKFIRAFEREIDRTALAYHVPAKIIGSTSPNTWLPVRGNKHFTTQSRNSRRPIQSDTLLS